MSRRIPPYTITKEAVWNVTRVKPFRTKRYLAMYIAEHVHVTHSSIAWSGSVCETHPVLDLDGFSAVHGQSTPPQTGGLRGDPFSPDVSLEEASWPSVQVNVRVCA